jgi:hypothetical protein
VSRYEQVHGLCLRLVFPSNTGSGFDLAKALATVLAAIHPPCVRSVEAEKQNSILGLLASSVMSRNRAKRDCPKSLVDIAVAFTIYTQ